MAAARSVSAGGGAGGRSIGVAGSVPARKAHASRKRRAGGQRWPSSAIARLITSPPAPQPKQWKLFWWG